MSLITIYTSSLDGWWFFTIVSQIPLPPTTTKYFIDDAGYLGSRTSLEASLAMAMGQNQTESIYTRTHVCRHIQRRQEVQYMQHNPAMYATRHGSRKCVHNTVTFTPYLASCCLPVLFFISLWRRKRSQQPAPTSTPTLFPDQAWLVWTEAASMLCPRPSPQPISASPEEWKSRPKPSSGVRR